jgi:hypothetical protein
MPCSVKHDELDLLEDVAGIDGVIQANLASAPSARQVDSVTSGLLKKPDRLRRNLFQ